MRTISKKGEALKQSILSKVEKNEIGQIQKRLGNKNQKQQVNQSESQTVEVDWDLINNLEHNKQVDEM
jgi:hypothetical protein